MSNVDLNELSATKLSAKDAADTVKLLKLLVDMSEEDITFEEMLKPIEEQIAILNHNLKLIKGAAQVEESQS